MTSNGRDAPRLVIAFPPLLYGIPFAAGIGADLAAPAPFLPERLQYALGAALGGIAALIMPFVLREYRKARTHFDPRRPSVRLLTTGPYRYSRNSACLALTLLYLGGAAAVDSLWVLAGAAPRPWLRRTGA